MEDFGTLPVGAVEDLGKSAEIYKPLTFDPTPYLHHLAESDLTEAQKHELLETLWSIIVSFVDMGFRISPIQQAMDKSPERESALSPGFTDVVKSKNNRKISRKRKLHRAPQCVR